MPGPGSGKYDVRRARLRKDEERSGIGDQDADRAAGEELQEGGGLRSSGPRTERGRGPEGERPGG
ncbi:hypothetical protein [Streptomyces glaucus]|uniref:Uncharacterized protein n=1 Tax=Streptomyces glaucus TaxID=284029 RepID=A0ABP5XNR2_9ACTN